MPESTKKWWSDQRGGGRRSDAPPRVSIHAQFASLIEAGLARRGWSRSDFARSMGVSPPHVTQVLRHPENLSLNIMLTFAEAAGVTLRLTDDRANEGVHHDGCGYLGVIVVDAWLCTECGTGGRLDAVG